MRRNDVGLISRSRLALLLLTTTTTAHGSLLVYAAPPVEEIRKIIAQKALTAPSPESLNALNSARLEVGLQAIDQYARYVPSSSVATHSSQSGRMGIQLFAYNSKVWIRPDSGGPADKAGLPEVGELQAINGKKVTSTNLARILTRLDKAVQNDHVSLTVSKRPTEKGNNYMVTAALFSPSSIYWHRIGSDLMMRINEFVSHDTAPGLFARFTALVHPGDRVVLDLRGCSGGDLYEALEIAGLFVSAGRPLISSYDRTGNVRTFKSPSGKKLHVPLLVLIDRRTASAAEILAGILQHHQLARVVGERSYGKCISQTLFPLSDGGRLWLTTRGIDFPDSTSCAGSGIKPDVAYPDISIALTEDVIKKLPNVKP